MLPANAGVFQRSPPSGWVSIKMCHGKPPSGGFSFGRRPPPNDPSARPRRYFWGLRSVIQSVNWHYDDDPGDSMGDVLTRAPVYFAAAQVIHNPVAAVSEEATRRELKEAFRRLGYSDQRDFQLKARVEINGTQLELPSQPPQLQCMNAERTTAVISLVDRFWVQTTHYLDFEAFRADFLAGLSALHEVLGLDYVDSVSMRMLDAIVPQPGESLNDYLPESLLGLENWGGERAWKLEHQGSEHVFSTGRHRVIFRSVRRPEALGFPPDCVPLEMELLDRHKQVQGVHVVLDTDVALEARQSFDVEAIGLQLVEIKSDLSQCFSKIVLEPALEKWK